MKRKKRTVSLLILTMIFLTEISVQAFGAQKLKEVVITVENDFKVGERLTENDVEVTTRSDRYSVGDIEIMNEIDVWGCSDTPEIEVTLEAEDGYYFSVVKSTINVKGGTYISGTKKGATTIILKIKLPSLREQMGEIREAHWSSQTTGSWSETFNAGYYELRLYRDGRSVGDYQNTVGTSFDFAPMMTRAGTYSYRVRGVNAQDNGKKSDWREADGSVYVDEATAQQFRSLYGTPVPEGVTEPGQLVNQQNQQYGWILDHVGWWYCNGDGSYTTSNWQMIDGKWYFFDSKGYMVTGWIDWSGKSYYCMPESGDMLVNAMVPDGSGRRVDSTGAWIQ